MNDDEAFKLNSLHRFDKRSRLVLEAHSHCEVPAGCGGAVFQWVNPAQGVAIRSHVSSSLRAAEAYFDGVPVRPGARLLPGPHVFAVALVLPKEGLPSDLVEPWLIAHLQLRLPGEPVYPERRLPGGDSRADGTWRVTSVQPADDWATPGFDDARWQVMREAKSAGSELGNWLRRLIEQGSRPLALERGPAWVRKRFSVPA